MSSPRVSSGWRQDPAGGSGGRRSFGSHNTSSSSGSGNGNSPRKSWNDVPGSSYAAQQQQRYQKGMSPRTHGSPNRSSSRGSPSHNIMSTSPSASAQLRQQKNQWNVERDIPTGTVRNNPFLPKPDPSNAPPPQLMHQKRQWDTANVIKRGSVAARAMSMEGAPPELAVESPRNTLRATPNSTLYERSSPSNTRSAVPHNSAAAGAASRRSFSREAPALATTNYRGRLIENPASAMTPPPAIERISPSNQWQPSREIPTGTVKGRVHSLYSANSRDSQTTASSSGNTLNHNYVPQTTARDYSRTASGKARGGATNTIKSRQGLTEEEDPWIIPAKTETTKQQQFFGDHQWGEEALAAKSAESDDWGAPATEWLGASASQETKESREQLQEQERGRNLGITEEKKVSEEESIAGHRDADVLELARKKQQQMGAPANKDTPFTSTNARDAEILRAAKEKTSFSSFQATNETSDKFEGDMFSDAQSSFQEEDQALQYAFPSNPFEEPTFETQEQAAGDSGTKKKKGFFGKLFGGRKTKATPKASSRMVPSSSSEPITKMVSQAPPSATAAADEDLQFEDPGFDDMHSESTGNDAVDDSEYPIEDGTFVSEMTSPTIFKDPRMTKAKSPVARNDYSSPRHKLHETTDTNYNMASESKMDQIKNQELEREIDEEAAMVTDAPSPRNMPDRSMLNMPPPPPPPRQAQRQTRVAAPAYDMDDAEDPALDHVVLDEADDEDESVIINRYDKGVPTPVSGNTRKDSSSNDSLFQRRLLDKRRSNRNVAEQSVATEERTRAPIALSGGVPKFVARHAKSLKPRSNSKPVEHPKPTPENPYKVTGTRNRLENKMVKASQAYQRQYAPPAASGMGTPDQPFEVDDASLVGKDSGSVGSQRTLDSASVSSDIRVLRSILRRPRRIPPSDSSVSTQPIFATYDEGSISDPMQRAGLRLLSAAVIPIQTEVRRFLAMRRALTRMWALIVIQTYARRWKARSDFVYERNAIMKVQALYRGREVRNELIYKHICAIEIQRHVRGYISTMRVYEDIYKVTMVQSFVRMKLAMAEATRRMALVIQLQAVARGFLTRNRLGYEEACAVAIQANWRCFFTRLTYQFDLLDVIIVQSVFRRKMASRKVETLRNARRERSATLIQTKWRSYDCTMNYLHYLADVLIVQSTVRRYLVLKQVRGMKDDAATKIQSAWRGFVCYADYMFSIADIVVTQKIARRWLAIRARKARRLSQQSNAATCVQTAWRRHSAVNNYKKNRAAIVIQSRWRGYLDETEFVVMKYEFYAARTIQSYWRRFWSFSNFVIALDCSIQIQSTFRGYMARQNFAVKKYAATQIQSVGRSYLARKELDRSLLMEDLLNSANINAINENVAATMIQSCYRGHRLRANLEGYLSACKIQSLVRGYQARTAVNLYLKASKIQAVWRAVRPRRAYKLYAAARTIQAFWRCKRMSTAYKFYRAALVIQAQFRMGKAQRDVLVMRGEYLAATLIQSAWRGFVCYTDYIFTVSDIISAQKTARRFLARKRYGPLIYERSAVRITEIKSSKSVQRVARGFIARQRYWYTLGCTMQIQSWMRGRLTVLRLKKRNASIVTLQSFARRILARQEFLQRKFILMLVQTADQERSKRVAAMVIQERARDLLDDKRQDEAARVIQRFFLMVKREVDRLVQASKKRKNWRRKMKKRNNKVEDLLLEDAWSSAIQAGTKGAFDNLAMAFSQDSGTNENRRNNGPKSNDLLAMEAVKYLNRSKKKKQSRDPCAEKPLFNAQSTHQRVLLNTYEKPQPFVRMKADDEQSEFSGLTASTANFVRVPMPKKKQLGARERDEDLELEEAFIDAEIFSAKERNMAQATNHTVR